MVWHYVDSLKECSVDWCHGPAILIDSITGERLCKECLRGRPEAQHEANVSLSFFLRCSDFHTDKVGVSRMVISKGDRRLKSRPPSRTPVD